MVVEIRDGREGGRKMWMCWSAWETVGSSSPVSEGFGALEGGRRWRRIRTRRRISSEPSQSMRMAVPFLPAGGGRTACAIEE